MREEHVGPVPSFTHHASRITVQRFNVSTIQRLYARSLAMAHPAWLGRLSRPQPRYGLAVCCGPGIPGTEARCGLERASAHRAGACAFDRSHSWCRPVGANQSASFIIEME